MSSYNFHLWHSQKIVSHCPMSLVSNKIAAGSLNKEVAVNAERKHSSGYTHFPVSAWRSSTQTAVKRLSPNLQEQQHSYLAHAQILPHAFSNY